MQKSPDLRAWTYSHEVDMSKNVPTGQNAVIQIEAEAASFGAIRTTDANGRARFEVTCGDCGKQAGMFNASINHAEQVLTHFRKQGWIFSHKVSPYCSTQCSRHAAQIRKDERRDEEMKQPTQAVHTPVIGPNPKIARRVITLLNEHFDTDKRLYHHGWSDERVAKEANASLEFVINYRKEAYAELAEDPVATKLRDDIKALEDLIQDYLQKLEDLKIRVDRFTGHYHKAQG